MAEEEKKEVSNTEVKEPEVKPSESETQARSLGWVPKDEYTGDKRWIDSEEFLERKELYDGIHQSNRKVKKLEKTIETLMAHNKQVEEAAYNRALEDLKVQKKVAAKENDVEKIVAIDEQINIVKEQVKAAKVEIKDDTQEVFEEWKKENLWFDESSDQFDEDMQAYANGIGNKLEKENDDWGPEKVLKEVAKRTKKAFELKFKNPNRENANKVGNKGNNTFVNKGNGKILSYSELPAEAKQMYKSLVKTTSNPTGVMTAEAYLKDYSLISGNLKEDSTNE